MFGPACLSCFSLRSSDRDRVRFNAIAIAMEDPLGIVYLVENAQQFWSGTFLFASLLYPVSSGVCRAGRHLESRSRTSNASTA